MSDTRIIDDELHVTHSLTPEQSRIVRALSPEQRDQFCRELGADLALWSRGLLLESFEYIGRALPGGGEPAP